MMDIYDFTVACADGTAVPLEQYRGRVLLVVNTASRCGFTPQYRELEELYQAYRSRGLEILAFPCNQFLAQEPGGNDEIQTFCRVNYGVSFPVFAKLLVNGPEAHPLYQWLKQQKPGLFGGSIKWNFTKFLIDRRGHVAGRFAPLVSPGRMAGAIEKLLSGDCA